MSLRIALYAEGRGETRGAFGTDPEPGMPIPGDHLGAGHELVRRTLAPLARVPESGVVFDGPLRLDGRTVVGSALLVGQNLSKLVLGGFGVRTPDLMVFLIDDDGMNRYASFVSQLDSIVSAQLRIAAVAVQEFESWLVADSEAASAAVGRSVDLPGNLENLSPRAAKRILREWTGDSENRSKRISIASTCDLDKLRRRCPSFARFEADARRVLSKSSAKS